MTSRLRALAATIATACLLVALPVTGAAGASTTSPDPFGAVGAHPKGAVAADPLASTGVVVSRTTGTTRLPAVHARSYLVADVDSGAVLAAKDAHGRFRPASALKLLTAVALLPALKPETVYTATSDDANVEGSKVGVVPDASYTVHNLFEAMFLVSGNDAAGALANAAGGLPLTVARMTRTARALGARDTTVVNASGLDADGQVSSAYDLALFARAGLARPDFRAYSSTVKSQFPGKMPRRGKARRTFQIYTQNKLVLNYTGAIGVKTGWTTLARGTFVGAATRRGRTLLVTLMHTEGRSWKEAEALLDWGFANTATTPPVGTIDQSRPVADAAVALRPRPVGRATASAPGRPGGSGLPWYAWVVVVLLSAVVALRARVLVRRQLRLRRRLQTRRTPVFERRP